MALSRLRRHTMSLLLAFVLLFLSVNRIGPRAIAEALGAQRRVMRGHGQGGSRRARTCCGAPGAASLIWVMLGDSHFQPYLMESIRQARLFNRDEFFFVVVDPKHFAWNHTWVPEMALLKVTIVNRTVLDDPFVYEFSRNYERLWDELGRKLGSMMQPTVNGKSNMDFTMVTMTRLVYVHQLMREFGIERVVHIENDQMIYGTIAHVKDTADACGVRLAMTRVGTRLAPATVYARDAAALKDMLDFILDAISQGVEHAIEVARTKWVTDMSLPAVYFENKAEAGDATATTFPTQLDGSCISKRGGWIFDGLPLGTWCCGSFEWPRKHLTLRMEESSTKYWDGVVEWRNVSGMRRPFWNGTDIFNIHMHSKQLKLFRSDEPWNATALLDVPEHN